MVCPLLCVASPLLAVVVVSAFELTMATVPPKKNIFTDEREHLNISAAGVITGFALTPGNGDERSALSDILSGISGLLIGDKGYH